LVYSALQHMNEFVEMNFLLRGRIKLKNQNL
jgi:hypothetical protein